MLLSAKRWSAQKKGVTSLLVGYQMVLESGAGRPCYIGIVVDLAARPCTVCMWRCRVSAVDSWKAV